MKSIALDPFEAGVPQYHVKMHIRIDHDQHKIIKFVIYLRPKRAQIPLTPVIQALLALS